MSSWPSKICVFGVWPIAMNTPVHGDVLRRAGLPSLERTPVTPDVVAQHLVERVVPHARACCRRRASSPSAGRCRIASARNLSRRCTTVTCFAMFDRYSASSTAVLPPPTTTHVLRLVEEAVAGRARRHALAHERLFRGQAEVARRRAGRDDQRVAGVFAAVADEADRPLVEVRRVDVVEDELGVEALGVLLEARHQVGPLHAVGVRRPVVDVGGRHQLAALRETGDQHGLQIGARRVYCGGVAGGAGAQDDQAGVLASDMRFSSRRMNGD